MKAKFCEDCKKKPASNVVEGAHLCDKCALNETALLQELGILPKESPSQKGA